MHRDAPEDDAIPARETIRLAADHWDRILKQGGYDWGYLAYAVGFGGSMIWFGSSAGVALSNMFPEGKDAIAWVRGGWHVAVAYVIGFFVMLAVLSWYPQPKHQAPMLAPTVATTLAEDVS